MERDLIIEIEREKERAIQRIKRKDKK